MCTIALWNSKIQPKLSLRMSTHKNKTHKKKMSKTRNYHGIWFSTFVFSSFSSRKKKKMSHRCTQRDKRFESYSTVVPFSMLNRKKKNLKNGKHCISYDQMKKKHGNSPAQYAFVRILFLFYVRELNSSDQNEMALYFTLFRFVTIQKENASIKHLLYSESWKCFCCSRILFYDMYNGFIIRKKFRFSS